jgi:hypothetical protein
MNQRSPLLNYRIDCDIKDIIYDEQNHYDFALGLWLNKAGEPLIKNYILSQSDAKFCESLLTKTRESIDRSEVSNNDCNKEIKNFGQSIITRTRESIDKSETSSECEGLMFQSLNTFTRESIDRSENS